MMMKNNIISYGILYYNGHVFIKNWHVDRIHTLV
jgi:hypothetical protein